MGVSIGGRLAEINAALRPGEVTAICGPNGAGKSTLLQCFAGLLAADGGAVTLDGVPITSLHPRERARAIGYLPQEGEIAWDLSVRNLVALGRLPYGDGGDAQVAAALAALDLETFSSRPVSTLSGGEKARALLARVGCAVDPFLPVTLLLLHRHEGRRQRRGLDFLRELLSVLDRDIGEAGGY